MKESEVMHAYTETMHAE